MNSLNKVRRFVSQTKWLIGFLLCLFPLANVAYAIQSDTIVIGLDADMSGVAKIGGVGIQRGAQIAIDEINANGGLLGKKLELLVKDHKGNPARGVHNINQFAKVNNLVAVVGGVHTPVALAELPDIHKHKLIYLGAWAAGTNIVENGFEPNYVFRVSLRDSDAGKVMVESAKKRGFSNIALVLERTPWGRSNLESISNAASNHNITITNISWINWNQTNFESETTTLIQTKPDAILLVANAPEGATLARHLLLNDEKTPIISHWGIASGQFVDLVGTNELKKLDVSVLQSFHFDNSKHNEVANKLLEEYKVKYQPAATSKSIEAAVGVAQAYDLIHLLALAIEKAQTLDREKIRAHMSILDSYKGAIKTYSYPFKETQDALEYSDYFMTAYDKNSELCPLLYTKKLEN